MPDALSQLATPYFSPIAERVSFWELQGGSHNPHPQLTFLEIEGVSNGQNFGVHPGRLNGVPLARPLKGELAPPWTDVPLLPPLRRENLCDISDQPSSIQQIQRSAPRGSTPQARRPTDGTLATLAGCVWDRVGDSTGPVWSTRQEAREAVDGGERKASEGNASEAGGGKREREKRGFKNLSPRIVFLSLSPPFHPPV